MSDNEGNSGQQPVEPTAEQLEKLLRTDMANQLAGLAVAFAPAFPQESLGEVVEIMLNEQMVIAQQIMPSLTDPEVLKQRRRFMIEIRRRNPGPDDKSEHLMVLKRLEDCATPSDALAQALMLAFLLSPAVRALLRMYGWDYLFKEPKGDGEPRASKLVLVGGN